MREHNWYSDRQVGDSDEKFRTRDEIEDEKCKKIEYVGKVKI
jgi:hypothetical protein